jgi:diguanylate cyclase (GGDEF)-like protein/PAS domain S-box-containing protein
MNERIVNLLQVNAELEQQIAARQRIESVLLQTKRRLQKLLAGTPTVVYSCQPTVDYGITFISDSVARFGYAPGQFLEHSAFWRHHIHPNDVAKVFLDLARLSDNQHCVLEYRFLQANGEYCWIQDHRHLIQDELGDAIEIIGSWQDITERKQIEQALFQEKERAQVTLRSIADAVITTDAIGCIDYLNPAAEQLTGWRLDQAQGLPLTQVLRLLNETTRQPADHLFLLVKAAGKAISLPYPVVLLNQQGVEYAVDSSAAPILDPSSQLGGAVITFRDMTQHRALSRQLSWQARHDPLTKLVNRLEFEQQLIEAVSSASNGHLHTICYLDLDQFKVVNDTCGHMAGDELLRQISILIQQHVRTTDSLARLGGDEFGIVLWYCPLAVATKIVEQVREAVQDYRFTWERQLFSIGVSIGLVEVTENIGDWYHVLSAADAACYAAKNSGRNRIHVYQADDQALAQQRSERQWVTQILQALEDNRFCLYQHHILAITPAETLETDEAATPGEPPPSPRAEILVRMISLTGEVIPPTAFIPAAERYGLMSGIDRWIISHFFSYCQRINAQVSRTTQPLYMINISGASLNDGGFLPFVQEQFAKYRVPPRQICFEMTETAAISNLTRASEFMQELKQLGCYFSLDDFGSGMSSFAYLKNFPVDFLKIDGHFVKDILSDPVDSAMVECIHRMAQALGICTIAEFVEETAILEKLKTIGIDYAQGYGIALPCPLEAI